MQKSKWVFIAVLAGVVVGGVAYRHFAQEVDARGATRLMRALEENNTDKMEDLLVRSNVNVRDKAGQTALFYAARHAQQPLIIHKLILAGADPLATDKHGFTPLMVAAATNPNPVITKVLSRYGGTPAHQQQNKDKALFEAARQNGFAVIKMLLIAHANPASQDESGRHAADYLAENPQLSEAEKTDLRQAMLLLEILDARQAYAAYGMSPKAQDKPAKPQPADKPSVQLAPAKPTPAKPTPAAAVLVTPTTPVEKQVAETKPADENSTPAKQTTPQ